ncbi:tetratricopeptide repeat protein [Candidatus Sumerlaeota bacterium]|nr:tetratricopeptide repeat protein [Candidatus Sumerlaeota bacterium]
MFRVIHVIAVLGLLLGLGACDSSEPITPVTTIQSTVFAPHAQGGQWETASETTRRNVWDNYEREFEELRRAKGWQRLWRLAREGHHFFPEERLAWLNLSTALYIWGDFGQAITAAHGALAEERREDHHPDTGNTMRPQAWCNIASCQIELRQLGEALTSTDEAIAINDRFARAWLLRGEVLHRLGRDAEALESYETALALEPQPPDIVPSDHILLSETLRALGQDEAAAQALRRAISEMPIEFGFHFYLGRILRDQGDLEAAHFEFQHEIALRPDSPYLERALTALGEMAAEAQSMPGSEAHQPLLRLAEAEQLRSQGDVDAAIAIWEERLAARPADESAIFLPLMVARALASASRPAEASEWYGRVIERDPLFVPAIVERAEVFDSLGETDRALDALVDAQRIDPFNWRLEQHYAANPHRTREVQVRMEARVQSEPASP